MSEMATTDLAVLRRRFSDWRRQHGGPGKRLPEALWTAATAVARQHGVHTAARALGLNYRALKNRVSGGEAEGAFVELSMNPIGAAGTVVELIGRDGQQMRIHLTGSATGDLMRLAEAFWSRLA